MATKKNESPQAKIKKAAGKIKKTAKANVNKAKNATYKEVDRVKQEMQKVTKKVHDFVKKNPEKAALISAGIGATIGTAVAALLGMDKGKKKKKK